MITCFRLFLNHDCSDGRFVFVFKHSNKMNWLQNFVKISVIFLFILLVSTGTGRATYFDELYFDGFHKIWNHDSWSLYAKGTFEYRGCRLILSPTAYSDKNEKALLILDPIDNSFNVQINNEAKDITLLVSNKRYAIRNQYYLNQKELKNNIISRNFRDGTSFYITWFNSKDQLYRSVRFEVGAYNKAVRALAKRCLVIIDSELESDRKLRHDVTKLCREKYKENFVNVRLTYDRFKCEAYSEKQLAEKRCRKEHKDNFYKVERRLSLLHKSKYECLTMRDYCIQVHGKNFRSVKKIGKATQCVLYMPQKKFEIQEKCKNTYREYFAKVEKVDSNYTCKLKISYKEYEMIKKCKERYGVYFKRVDKLRGVYQCKLSISTRHFFAIERCQKEYGRRYVDVNKYRGKYNCIYR